MSLDGRGPKIRLGRALAPSPAFESAVMSAGVLLAAGLTINDVVKTTVFMTDLGQFAAMNEVYAKHFHAPFPARATVQVSALPKGALIEIEAIAVRP